MHLQTATAPGSAHVNPGQPGKINNQDVFTSRKSKKNQVIVLCDGCGSQPYSGTGADIGANLIANSIFGELENGTQIQKLKWNKLMENVVDVLRQQVSLFVRGSSAEAFEQAVMERFLFTAMVLVIQEDTAVVASFGDGVVIIDEETIIIEPPIANAPPYLGYKLISNSAYHAEEFRSHLGFSVIKEISLSELGKSLIIGTDGLKDLVQEDWHHPALVQPKQLQRWINTLTSEKIDNGKFIAGKCPDDVTVAIFRTKESQAYLLEERREIATLKQEISGLKTEINDFVDKCQRETTYYEDAIDTIEDLEKRLEPLQKKAESIRPVAREIASLQATLQKLKTKLPPEPKPEPKYVPGVRVVPVNYSSPTTGVIASVTRFLRGFGGPPVQESEIDEDFEVRDPVNDFSFADRRRYRDLTEPSSPETREEAILRRFTNGLPLSASEEIDLERILSRRRVSRPVRVQPSFRHGRNGHGKNGKGARR